jgi:hypothetical protein
LAALLVVAAGAVAVRAPLGTDYGNLGCHLTSPRCDEPAWPLEALARGNVAVFIHNQPLMGPASLVLRAPFAAVARVFDGSLAWHYRAGVFACMLLLGLLAFELMRRSAANGHSPLYSAVVGVLAFINPLMWSTIEWGHPEELVAAVGVTAAGLLVIDRRWTLGGIALGVALASKAWVILAVPLLLLAVAPAGRRRFALIAALVVLAFYAPLIVGDANRFKTVAETSGSLGSRYGEVSPPNAWFFTAGSGDFALASAVRDGQIVYSDAMGYRVSPLVARLAHSLILASAIALAYAWYRARGIRRPETLMLMLAAILLLRCILDPGNHLYYHAAAALAFLAFDALRPGGRFPWLSSGFILALWLVTRVDPYLHTDTAFAVVYLAVAVPLFALAVGVGRRASALPEPFR